SIQEIQELDKDDESLRVAVSADPNVPNVVVTRIDKTDYMVGSYGPRAEEYEFLTPMEEAPKGMLARGSYNIK
uniref:Rho GDP-dissociation inhibitor 1 (Fragments) n=1 Tax=Bos taurus TaxID=9913 RepID=Q7M2Q9_BOVIN